MGTDGLIMRRVTLLRPSPSHSSFFKNSMHHPSSARNTCARLVPRSLSSSRHTRPHRLLASFPAAVRIQLRRVSLSRRSSESDADTTASTLETDEQLVEEAQRVLKLLSQRRDMSLNEVRLVLMVEDPRATKRREEYGIEVASGVSRDEILDALTDVSAGRVPQDKLALRQLVTELQNWPYLQNDDLLRGTGPSPYAEVTNTGTSKAQRMEEALARSKMDEVAEGEVNEAPDLSDYLPKWVGFSAVYLISAIPVFITLSVLALLFITSLK